MFKLSNLIGNIFLGLLDLPNGRWIEQDGPLLTDVEGELRGTITDVNNWLPDGMPKAELVKDVGVGSCQVRYYHGIVDQMFNDLTGDDSWSVVMAGPKWRISACARCWRYHVLHDILREPPPLRVRLANWADDEARTFVLVSHSTIPDVSQVRPSRNAIDGARRLGAGFGYL